MKPGTRIRLTRSCPWPERVGLLGRIAVVPDDQRGVYPAAGLGRGEVIVLLDDDPITAGRYRPRWWTCVLGRSSVEEVPDA